MTVEVSIIEGAAELEPALELGGSPAGRATWRAAGAARDAGGEASDGPARRRAGLVGRLVRRPGVVVAVVYVAALLLAAVAPFVLAHGDPSATSPHTVFQAPSFAHWFGTDQLGRDQYTRFVYGSSLSIEATIIAVGVAVLAGLVIGVVSGFVGGVVDAVLMRFIDVLLAIPALLLSLAIVTALGFGTVNVALAVGVGITPGFARVTRSEVLRVRTLPYIEAARIGGGGLLRVLWRHVLPNSWGPVLVLAVLDFGTALLAVASLSFLGFGAPPPSPEWGSLISDGRNYLATSPWLALLPGLAVGLVVLALNHIGKTIEELQR
ncbi:ABC transporter permease [Rathayibacter sp. KR2-224]|uniref:ABC transporter permease n=1 Tax=Rathayibacter sp. KR2-224 TaxID=3400913 RepID=UPI003C069AEB